MLLTSCGKEDIYQKQNIPTRDNIPTTYKEELAIGLEVQVKEDAKMYSDKDKSTAFDILEKGSIVKVILESEDGYTLVSYAGQDFYLETKTLL